MVVKLEITLRISDFLTLGRENVLTYYKLYSR